MTVNGINLNSYELRKPLNLAQKAEQVAGPDTLATQRSKEVVKSNQTFQFKDSVSSKDEDAMIQRIKQQLVKDALIGHAAMIRSSHETKGVRTESAK